MQPICLQQLLFDCDCCLQMSMQTEDFSLSCQAGAFRGTSNGAGIWRLCVFYYASDDSTCRIILHSVQVVHLYSSLVQVAHVMLLWLQFTSTVQLL